MEGPGPVLCDPYDWTLKHYSQGDSFLFAGMCFSLIQEVDVAHLVMGRCNSGVNSGWPWPYLPHTITHTPACSLAYVSKVYSSCPHCCACHHTNTFTHPYCHTPPAKLLISTSYSASLGVIRSHLSRFRVRVRVSTIHNFVFPPDEIECRCARANKNKVNANGSMQPITEMSVYTQKNETETTRRRRGNKYETCYGTYEVQPSWYEVVQLGMGEMGPRRCERVRRWSCTSSRVLTSTRIEERQT